jgi:ABC-type amino acid transport system permease subunit
MPMDIFSERVGGYTLQMLHGGVITIELFMSGFLLALSLGTVVGIVSLSRNVIFQGLYKVYLS